MRFAKTILAATAALSLPALFVGCVREEQESPRFHRVFCWGTPSSEEVARKYAEIGVTDIRVNSKKSFDLAVKYGMTPYCGVFTPAGPYTQVMSEEEKKYHACISGQDLPKNIARAERNKITDKRCVEKGFLFGGETEKGVMNVMAHRIACFNSDENYSLSKKRLDRILDSAVPGVKGIYFDGISYMNQRGCFCAKCLADCKKFLAEKRLADTEENRDLFYREVLVKYYNDMIDYVKSKRPDFKVMAHLWPVFRPDPLFGNRTKTDYCGQTVAWYFPWPLDKVSRYTDFVLKHAKDYYANAEGIPFVGLNAAKGQALSHKTPEQLEKELQTILSAGGRTLMVCNGPDMIKPGYFEVFRKYCTKEK